MANTKRFLIEGRVNYDWISHATPEQQQVLAAVLLRPRYARDLIISYKRERGEKIEYKVRISGIDSLRLNTYVHLYEAIALTGVLTRLLVTDLDDGQRVLEDWTGRWHATEEELFKEALLRQIEANKVKQQVDEMMKGKHWKRTATDEVGVTYELVPDIEEEHLPESPDLIQTEAHTDEEGE